jgi:hypothetical protein
MKRKAKWHDRFTPEQLERRRKRALDWHKRKAIREALNEDEPDPLYDACQALRDALRR